jgi:hypothetical protein
MILANFLTDDNTRGNKLSMHGVDFGSVVALAAHAVLLFPWR